MRNRAELAEGWYDPATLQKAQASAATDEQATTSRKPPPRVLSTYNEKAEEDASSEYDVVGPSLPGREIGYYGKRSGPGPAIPNTQDLELKRGILLDSTINRASSY